MSHFSAGSHALCDEAVVRSAGRQIEVVKRSSLVLAEPAESLGWRMCVATPGDGQSWVGYDPTATHEVAEGYLISS